MNRLKHIARELALLALAFLIATVDLLLPRLITGVFDELGIMLVIGTIIYLKIKAVLTSKGAS